MLDFLKLWPYVWPLIKEYVFGAPAPGKNRPSQPSVKGPWGVVFFIMLGLMFAGDLLAIVSRELEQWQTQPILPKTKPVEPKTSPVQELRLFMSELQPVQVHPPLKPAVKKTARKAAQERLERLKEEESKG